MNAPAWEPQPTLAWAACHGVVGGRFCTTPAAGFALLPGTGMMLTKFSMCEQHGNPPRGGVSPSGKEQP